MDISVIIPNYNGEDLLKANLPKVIKTLEDYRKGSVEIIVVDDASEDNSISVVEDEKSKIDKDNLKLKIIKNNKNFGFSQAINLGVDSAIGEIVILLNSDVHPENNFLKPLLVHFKDEDVFAVGCMDKSLEDGKIILRGRGLGKWEKGFLIHKRGEVGKTDTLWVSGGSGAFRKSIWKKLGGFNELYSPFYWEDIDLSYRARKSGYGIIFEPKSMVIHEHAKGAVKKYYSDFKIKTIAYRNQFIFVWENATDYSLQFLHFFWLPYHFVKALFRADWAFFIGFFKAFILLPKVIKSSLNYQRTFVKKDKEVIEEIQQ